MTTDNEAEKGKSDSLIPEFGPLRGMKVIDTCRFGACHLGATLLAEFGATVVHIDAPPFHPSTIYNYSDNYRYAEPIMPRSGEVKVSAHGVQNGRNKLYMTLDFLNSEEGKETFKRLLQWADVLIEASRPSTFEKHGWSDDYIRSINPRLSVIHLSGFGQTGPKRNKLSHDLDIQAFTGFASLIGYENEPLRVPWTIADYVVSVWIAFSAVMAYIASKTLGFGDIVDLAQYEVFVRTLDPYYTLLATYPELDEPKRHGNTHPEYFPYGFYKCADGWISVSAPFPNTWPRLRKLLNLPEIYDNMEYRNARREEVEEALRKWLSTKKAEEAERILNGAGVPACKVNSTKDFLNDEHVKARNLIVEWKDENIGPVRGIGIVPRFYFNPGKIWRGYAKFNQDTEYILKKLLGYSNEKIKELREKGVIA